MLLVFFKELIRIWNGILPEKLKFSAHLFKLRARKRSIQCAGGIRHFISLDQSPLTTHSRAGHGCIPAPPPHDTEAKKRNNI